MRGIARAENVAKVIYHKQMSDLMAFVTYSIRAMKDDGIEPGDAVFVDVVGVGKGYYDRLRELAPKELPGVDIVGVNFGEAAQDGDDEDFSNLRAQAYWRTMMWINHGGKLVMHSGWEELLGIRWKYQQEKQIKIKSKEDMLKDGIESPDVADTLALTFSRRKENKIRFTQKENPPISEYDGGAEPQRIYRPHRRVYVPSEPESISEYEDSGRKPVGSWDNSFGE